MIHDRKALQACLWFNVRNVVILAHSHMPSIEHTDTTLWLNPGSAGPRRFRLPITLGLLWEEAGGTHAMVHSLAA